MPLKNSLSFTPVFKRRWRLWIAGNVARLITREGLRFAVIRTMQCRLLTVRNGNIYKPIPISGICGKAIRRQKPMQLKALAPEGQVLIACQGYLLCQRGFRSITCRAFPFFPYITRQGQFIGLSVYWEYEERCWVINNLQVVSHEYREEFIHTFDDLFARLPEELEVFRQFSARMRRVFGRRHSAIPLLHRNGGYYKISPQDGRARKISPEKFRLYGPYKIAAGLPFPDEAGSGNIELNGAG